MRHGRDHRALHLWHLLTRLGRQELALLLRVLLVASALWAFATLANAVVVGETRAFDRAVLATRAQRPSTRESKADSPRISSYPQALWRRAFPVRERTSMSP